MNAQTNHNMDFEQIEVDQLVAYFNNYLAYASQFRPGIVDYSSRSYVTTEVPTKIRWFPIAADKVQTSFPPEIDYWVDKAAQVLEKAMGDRSLQRMILANLNLQYAQSPYQLSLAKALEEPFKDLFDQLFVFNDVRFIIGFLAAFIPNGLDGLGLIFTHLRIFLVNTPENGNLLKQFLLNTPFAGQFVNSDARLSEANCPYKSFSITAIDKHIFAAIDEFYNSHPKVSIAATTIQKGTNFQELSLLAGKILEHFMAKLPSQIDKEAVLAVMNRG